MIPSRRLPFDLPGEPTDAAKLIFENSHSLNISISRPMRVSGPVVFYELHGGFEQSDGDLLELMQALIRGFSQLPRVGRPDDDDGDDDWKGGAECE